MDFYEKAQVQFFKRFLNLLFALVVPLLLAPLGEGLAQSCCPDGNSIITTIAGTGVFGFGGDGGPATSATFNNVMDVLIDPGGNLYCTDFYNNRIRKITPGGIITTIAGTGVFGYSGDGGPATSATFWEPAFLLMDASGNLYVADLNNSVVRKITPGGIISTFAGTGTSGFSGDGGPATSAHLDAPEGLVWTAGNLYIWDDTNQRIRKVDSSGIITTFAGNGGCCDTGDGGPALSASLGDAEGLGACNGNIYLADWGQKVVRMVDPCGIIHPVAGTANAFLNDSGDGGPASASGVNQPEGMFFDPSGDMYLAERGGRIRKLTRDCSPTPTLACTIPPTYTGTPTPTSTPSNSPTLTPTPTITPTFTITNTPTLTPTLTPTPSLTLSPTNSPTGTPTPTFTPTWTFTPTCVSYLWPDPFNPQYAFNHTLKISCLPVGSTVYFFTLAGEQVNQVPETSGMVQWDGKNQQGVPISTGIYYYVIQNGNNILGKGKFLVTH